MAKETKESVPLFKSETKKAVRARLKRGYVFHFGRARDDFVRGRTDLEAPIDQLVTQLHKFENADELRKLAGLPSQLEASRLDREKRQKAFLAQRSLEREALAGAIVDAIREGIIEKNAIK